MRKAILLAIAFGLMTSSSGFAVTNTGSMDPAVFKGNELMPDGSPCNLLYCPSEADDPTYRAACDPGGGSAYFDARAGVPSAATLDTYDVVHTWANYAYLDNVGMGNALADYVDRGGCVILGAFAAYTSGNYLSGRIMTQADMCPVTGGTNHFSTDYWDGTDAGCCAYQGVTGWGAFYRDVLSARPGAVVCGHFTDRELAVVTNAAGNVSYVNGAGGNQLGAPIPQLTDVVRNVGICCCGGATAAQSTTWGTIKDLYR